jgi:natural product precursor
VEKKKVVKKLKLSRETIKSLRDSELAGVAGGATETDGTRPCCSTYESDSGGYICCSTGDTSYSNCGCPPYIGGY